MNASSTSLLRRLVLLIGSSLVVGTAHAHEFWIQPGEFLTESGELLKVRLMHGERFNGDVVARNEPYVKRFDFVSEGTTTPVLGRHGSPVSFLRPTTSGVVVYQSHEYANDLPADRFEAYLAEEGLTRISQERIRLGETDTQGREAYIRCAKALIQIDQRDASAAGPVQDRAVGLPLEIVLEGSGGHASEMTARVLFEGKPLIALRVVAVCEGDPTKLIELKTDEEGRVAFLLDSPGTWMLTTLHMIRTPERSDIDWKSFWASLSFPVPG